MEARGVSLLLISEFRRLRCTERFNEGERARKYLRVVARQINVLMTFNADDRRPLSYPQ
jgi:hypothetical protein